MNQAIISTSSYARHSEEQMAFLAEKGFTHVLMATQDRQSWEEEVELGHRYGLRMIVRWPNWNLLNCCNEDMAFRAWDGTHNATGDTLVTGPSLWNMEAEDRALAELPRIMEDGWDGVLVHIIVGDRAFPTAWHLTPRYDLTMAYWSFDEWARKDWGTYRNAEPMPTKGGEVEDLSFYRWYQAAWFRRLGVFSSAALSHVRAICTYYVPMNWWDPQTMADGTADSVGGIQQWRMNILEEGGDPLVVVAHMFGMGSSWQPKAERTMQEMNQSGWQSIVGVECVKPGESATNLEHNSALAHSLGFCGILAGDSHLYGEADAIRNPARWWE